VQVSPAPDLSGSYRVTVGSFKDVANAQRLIETLKKQGYPARTDPAGEVTRVWVGPYSLSKARAIADALGQYQPQVTRIAGPATTAQPQTPTAQPPAPTSTAKYLQVGAFRSAASAQAVVEKVREAGYPVVLVEGGGLVRVRVGPLDNPSEAAAALRAKGLDVLEVR
jgi:cell division septation protein DedD